MERIRQVQHSASEPVRYDGDDETDKIVALAGLGPAGSPVWCPIGVPPCRSWIGVGCWSIAC